MGAYQQRGLDERLRHPQLTAHSRKQPASSTHRCTSPNETGPTARPRRPRPAPQPKPLTSWHRNGFSDDDDKAWTSARLRPNDGDLAAKIVEAGIAPTYLAGPVCGATAAAGGVDSDGDRRAA